MIIRVISLLFMMAAVSGFGQPPNNRGEAPRQSRSLNYGNWVGKRVLTKEFMEHVGIQDEQAKKLTGS